MGGSSGYPIIEKKKDRYTGFDKDGVLHNIEVHQSGVHPDTWICGNCGTKLKGEDHYVGLSKGIRYCKKCGNQGKMLSDMPHYDIEELKNNKSIIWDGVKGRHV